MGKQFIKAFPKQAEIKKTITELKEATEVLQKILYNTHGNIITFLDELPNIYENKFKYKIKADNPSWTLSRLISDLKTFNLICRRAAVDLGYQKSKGGSKKISAKKIAILLLAGIYYQGTEQEPICKYSDKFKKYTGDFYYFLLELNALVLKKIAIELGEPSTIGKYAKEASAHYRKNIRKKELSSKPL